MHGFKDIYKNEVDRYSGTSSRWGQRAVVATAVQMNWELASLDISQAFLKGLTFDEIQEIRGGPKREVSMQLPRGKPGLEPSGASVLRNLKGFEDFNDALEVLEMIKGGFGLVDAPNLFTTRVDHVLKTKLINSTISDPKMYLEHDKAKALQLMVSAHMDDFKSTGEPANMKALQKTLADAFGNDVKMTYETTFIHTGIRHTYHKETKEYTLDQDDYSKALRPVTHADLLKAKDDVDLNEYFYACFLTLLGAVAWLSQTRLDVLVYISSLQRVSKKPTTLALKRLNRLVRYIQKHPHPLRYRRLLLPVKLCLIGDSAFRAPTGAEDGAMVMRGFLVALGHYDEKSTTWFLQILEYLCGRQKHVCRGVWSAELLNLCDLWDMGLIIAGFLEEVKLGSMSAADLRKHTTEGPLSTDTQMFTDSYSIFSYLRTEHLKFPTDKGTFFHLAHLHQACARQLLRTVTWVDTRDMVMDGMTKGKIDRKTLHELMAGRWKLEHKADHYTPTHVDNRAPDTSDRSWQ